MPKSHRHGTRSRYVSGCTDGEDGKACEPCKLAEANYQKKRRQDKKSNVIALATGVTARVGGDDLNGRPDPEEYEPGPTEAGVIKVLENVPAAKDRPDLVASARAMARIQDTTIFVAQQTNAATRMLEIMDRLLKGTQKKRKLAAVRQMTNNSATG